MPQPLDLRAPDLDAEASRVLALGAERPAPRVPAHVLIWCTSLMDHIMTVPSAGRSGASRPYMPRSPAPRDSTTARTHDRRRHPARSVPDF
jgi:hypothetical protein